MSCSLPGIPAECIACLARRSPGRKARSSQQYGRR
jgi:hypothetical protein